jgi:hypothetical protein
MLARRVGYRCSNPGCRKLTSGPQVDPTKALNIGVAAHIAAASPGGKRYDSTMSPKDRKSINNGIWLCQNCAKLVDNDEQRYPTSQLLGWKSSAEQAALQEIENSVPRTGTSGTFDLPYPDTFFVGRTEELSLLSNLLEQARSIVVAGTGGIGKTQLIVQALHLRDDIPTIWIDVESYLRVEDLQLALSSALQEKGFTASSNLIQALYTTSIRIVFDGVEQAIREGWDDIEDFFHLLLTRTRTPQFIFTSQVALDNLEPDYQLLLEPLQTEDAKEILQTRGILGKELNLAEENALTWLVDFAEGHTLTLRLIAAQLKRLREPVVVKECIEQLGSSALDKPRRQKHTRLTSLNIALRLAYESLTSEQKNLLLYLSCLPGGCWHIWLERAARSKNLKIDIAEICDWYLVDQNQDNLNQLRYNRVLSPIRAFVQTIENSINPDAIIHVQNEISHQFMHHALMLNNTYMQFGDVGWGIEIFEMDLPNFFAALEYGYEAQERSKTEQGEDWQESNQVVFRLASGLAIYFFVRGHLQRGITTLRKGIHAGRQLGNECGHLYTMLVVMYGRVFNQEGLSSVLSEFKVIADHSSNPDLKAQYANSQGEFAFVKGDYKSADSYYQQAEQYYTEALNEALAVEDEIEKTKTERSITQLLAETLGDRARAHEYMKRIVLIAGFESFNADLYRKAAHLAHQRCPELDIRVFSDISLSTEPKAVEEALQDADVFFGSLIFDYDQVLWLRERVQHIPIRLVFESALELMSLTQIGDFKIGDKPKGMPKPVKFILDKFSNGREEDKLAGYISFLKVGPKLLKYIPAKKVQDLRNWLIIYGYWNAGGTDNVASMFWTLAEKYLGLKVGEIPPPVETPNMGLLHPDYQGFFESPRQYLEWYRQREQKNVGAGLADNLSEIQITSHILPLQGVVGILLYRKHVFTKQPYIPQLIRYFEKAGLVPVPIFINGVEGHVAVRDWMTSPHETRSRQLGNVETPSLSSEAVEVDAIVSTIGFPLVGGPAGSMEAGRQVEVAKRILTAKNVPYIVAAPLLIQDIHSWTRQGVGGLQSVVLYALPELDGAIDPVPLGGLVGEDIYLIPERVMRLTGRIKRWIALRKTPPSERKIAIILYGFPPGYGATGTAALLNVPRSLLKFLHALKDQGYNVGELPEDGEELIRKVKEADEVTPPYEEGARGGSTVNAKTLEKWLGYLLTTRIEKQWQSLTGTGIKTYGDEFQIGGVQLGNIWIGVQPPLGIAGDPMRLMFERDLTPHPQYAAFINGCKISFKLML